jgi:hydroxymethylpyrimidine pyrophosphatase-like HAD family hydrolase
MLFKALACDYDGTLASQDRIGPETIAALGAAREAGVRVILATGRAFFDLTLVCEQLDLFDAVVAENGGVIHYPATGEIRSMALPPPPRVLAELDRRNIPYLVGRVVVGTSRADEDRVGEALAAAGVSLERVYNRGALMLLPAGVSKGTGVGQVIRHFGLSFHDVLALGDSENDAELFEACGWAACPANAVPVITAKADWVFPGDNGHAIAHAITGPILGGRLPVASSPRHRVEIGWVVGTAEALTVPARGVNLLIHGDPLSGKSWLAGVLVERLHERRYAVCVIDPEGDYRVLARLGGVSWSEVRDAPSMERAIVRFEHDPAACVVADLSALPHPSKVRVVEAGLQAIRDIRRRRGLPHWVVLDEAHYSLHSAGVAERAFGFEDKGFCLVTYRSSWLCASALGAMDILMLARTTIREELAFLEALVGTRSPRSARAVNALPDLPYGEFVVVEPGTPGPVTFVAAPRATTHVRHLRKYADSTVAPDLRFVFRREDGWPVGVADSLLSFRQAVETLDDAVLAHHAARGDLSRWVLDVFADRELAAQLRKAESRWLRGELPDLRRAVARSVAVRYGMEE